MKGRTRTVSFLAALVFLRLHSAEAVPISLCNTGQAAGCVGTVAEGTIDPNYTVIAAPDAANLGATKVVSTLGFPFPPWITNDADSQWIGPSVADAESNGPVGSYTYRTTFTLAGLNPSTANISGLWSTDNNGLDILINGVSTSHTTGFADFGSLFAFSISSGFVGGLNTLDFVLNNGGGPTGLRIDSIAGSADALAAPPIPEPATLLLLGVGVAGLAGRTYRRRYAAKR